MSILGAIAHEALELPWLVGRERSVLRHIADCRTERLGGNVMSCTCGHLEVHYNSCRDRHCPLCQGAARARWVHARLGELLQTAYFHVVFTVPHELVSLALANRGVFYRALFASVHETLLAVCANPENLGARSGGMSILHTWNQRLAFHPHVHCIVPGGGISPDGASWITGNPNYLVPVRRLSAVFRGKLLMALERLLSKGNLLGDDLKLRTAIRKAAGKDFVVYAKRPFGGPEQVVKYLGRYTHRVGISEQRIVAFKDGRVSFSWIDRKSGNARRLMSLQHGDFVRTFTLHILPKGLRKIRYFGYLGNRDRTASIARVRALIARSVSACDQSEPFPPAVIDVAAAGSAFEAPGITCPECGLRMSVRSSVAAPIGPGWLKARLALRRTTHGPEPNGVAAP